MLPTAIPVRRNAVRMEHADWSVACFTVRKREVAKLCPWVRTIGAIRRAPEAVNYHATAFRKLDHFGFTLFERVSHWMIPLFHRSNCLVCRRSRRTEPPACLPRRYARNAGTCKDSPPVPIRLSLAGDRPLTVRACSLCRPIFPSGTIKRPHPRIILAAFV